MRRQGRLSLVLLLVAVVLLVLDYWVVPPRFPVGPAQPFVAVLLLVATTSTLLGLVLRLLAPRARWKAVAGAVALYVVAPLVTLAWASDQNQSADYRISDGQMIYLVFVLGVSAVLSSGTAIALGIVLGQPRERVEPGARVITADELGRRGDDLAP